MLFNTCTAEHKRVQRMNSMLGFFAGEGLPTLSRCDDRVCGSGWTTSKSRTSTCFCSCIQTCTHLRLYELPALTTMYPPV